MKKFVQRAGIVTLILACIMCLNIQATFGLEEETAAPESMGEPAPDPGTSVDPVSPAEPDTPSQSEPPSTPDTPSKPDIPAEPDVPSEPDMPSQPNTPSEPGLPTEPDVPSEPGTPAEPDIPSEPGTPAEPDIPSEPGTPAEPDVPSEPDMPSAPDVPSKPATPSAPVTPSAPEKPLVIVTPVLTEEETAAAGTANDSVKAADSSFTPFGFFVDSREKIKYNVKVPIEGIPSFVTSEMVAGALKCQDESGYPASVTIAQIIQESGFGKYGQGGSQGYGLSYLAFQYNNLFGIKGIGPAGSVNMPTGEQTPAGESYMTSAGFRVYHTYTESIEDRTKVLREAYGDLTANVKDANTFAMKIGGRWATDVQYGKSLIKQMETFDLYRLDKLTLNDFNDMTGTFANPCPGATYTSGFGYRAATNSMHEGIDLGTGSENLPTYAAAAGTVITVGSSDTAGNWIAIDHGNGLMTKYMHHDAVYVTEGQYVEKGQQIGLSGNTGRSTGNHLHFQVEKDQIAVNPLLYLEIED